MVFGKVYKNPSQPIASKSVPVIDLTAEEIQVENAENYADLAKLSANRAVSVLAKIQSIPSNKTVSKVETPKKEPEESDSGFSLFDKKYYMKGGGYNELDLRAQNAATSSQHDAIRAKKAADEVVKIVSKPNEYASEVVSEPKEEADTGFSLFDKKYYMRGGNTIKDATKRAQEGAEAAEREAIRAEAAINMIDQPLNKNNKDTNEEDTGFSLFDKKYMKNIWKAKYLKYKQKYLDLKSNII